MGLEYFAKRELTTFFVFDIEESYFGISICGQEQSS